MPEVTYIEFNGTEHRVEVPVGTSVMRGAVGASGHSRFEGDDFGKTDIAQAD